MDPQYKKLAQPSLRARLRRVLCIVVLVGSASGCTNSKPLYYWGDYEDLLYSRFVNPGEADPTTQVIKLSQDIQIAQDNGQRVPPGIHAQLGYMLYLQGNGDAALQALKTEKALYPEASVFVNRMIERLTR